MPINHTTSEQNAIRLTMLGSFGLSVIGVGTAFYTGSEAILFDGLFTLVDLPVAIATLRVAQLVVRPGNERFPFGYAALEPMLNMGKGLMTIVICIFALLSAISSLFQGGRPIEADIAALYAIISMVVALVVARYLTHVARTTGSSLIAVDAREWLIDGVISGAIAVAFIAAQFAIMTPFAFIEPYVDPVIVTTLVFFLLPLPISIFRESWNQIIGRSICDDDRQQIEQVITNLLVDHPLVSWWLRSTEQGRVIYIHLTIFVGEHDVLGNVSEHDVIRRTLRSRVQTLFPTHFIDLDLIITRDRTLADPMIGEGES